MAVRVCFTFALLALIAAACGQSCNWKCGAVPECVELLGDDAVWTGILTGSANTENSLGNYFSCTNSGQFQMCVADVPLPGGEFIGFSHGFCLPNQCAAIASAPETVATVTLCPPSTVVVYYEECVLREWYANCEAKFNTTKDIEKCEAQFNVSMTRATQLYAEMRALLNVSAAIDAPGFELHCGPSDETTLDKSASAVLFLLLLLASLCLLAEMIHDPTPQTAAAATSLNDASGDGVKEPLLGAVKPRRTPKWKRIILAFSLSDNLNSLFERAAARSLAGLDGLRVLSILLIINGHTVLLSLAIGADDPNTLVRQFHTLSQQVTVGADLAVDTFFLLGGLLTTYTIIRRARKSGRRALPIVPAIVLRYLRLTPVYAFVIAIFAALANYFGSGPMWWRMSDETNQCSEYWWTNLLYINNFYPTTFHTQCISWSWYLANDMQFFIVALVILFVYLRSKAAGAGLAAACVVVGVASTFGILYNYREEEQDKFYDKPYCRITSFAVGVLLGMAMVDTKIMELNLSRTKAFVAMAASISMVLTIIYVMYDDYRSDLKPNENWTDAQYAAYSSFGRLAYAIGICGVLLLCITKNGGVVGAILALPIWEPLGKLTFGAYLIHPIIMRCYTYRRVDLIHFDTWEQIILFGGYAVASFACAMMLHLLVELPFANLSGMLLSKA